MNAPQLERRCAPILPVGIPSFTEAANIDGFGHEPRDILDATSEASRGLPNVGVDYLRVHRYVL